MGVYNMDNNWISLLQNQNQLSKVIETNQYTEQFGLTLSQQDMMGIKVLMDMVNIKNLTSRSVGATSCILKR